MQATKLRLGFSKAVNMHTKRLRRSKLSATDRGEHMIIIVLQVEGTRGKEVLTCDLLIGLNNGGQNIFICPDCEVFFSCLDE